MERVFSHDPEERFYPIFKVQGEEVYGYIRRLGGYKRWVRRSYQYMEHPDADPKRWKNIRGFAKAIRDAGLTVTQKITEAKKYPLYAEIHDDYYVCLNPRFFNDEEDEINRFIKETVNRRKSELVDQLIMLDLKLGHLEAQKKKIYQKILHAKCPGILTEIDKLERELRRKRSALPKLKEIKETYYYLLKEKRLLSKTRLVICHNLLIMLDTEYRNKLRQKKLLLQLAGQILRDSREEIKRIHENLETEKQETQKKLEEVENLLQTFYRDYREQELRIVRWR